MVLNQGFGAQVQNDDDPEVYQANLATYFSSADILVVSNSVLTPEATRGGYVLDLMPLTSSDVDFDSSAFHQTMLSAFQWDNGQWALPISASFVVVSYIPEAFDNAGIAYPTESWTLDDLENAARTLTQKNADGTIALPGMIVQGNNASLPPLFMSLTGSGFATDATFPGSPDFSNPQLAADLDNWFAFVAEGLMEVPDDVNNNQIPLIIGNPQFGGGGGGFGGGNQDAPVRATALLPGGGAGLSVNGYAISRGTLYPQESYDFLKFLVNHPNAVTANLSTTPAVIGLEAGGFGGPGGGPGGPGGGGFVPEALQPLLDTAIERGISDTRFSTGITAALNLMTDGALDARAALDEIQNTFLTRLAVADTHAATRISVVAPTIAPVLAPGEVALDFAILGGGGPGGGGGGGFGAIQQWQGIADQFVADDAEVGIINFDTENANDLATVTENYDCFYSSTNLIPDADLSQLLSFDPLVSVDPAFDPDDFIAGVFTQVSANNQMYAYPLQISPLVLRFNADIFTQAGVPLPQSSWTVSELQDALGQLKFVLTDDQFPLELNASGQTALLMLIAAYGGIPFDTRTSPPTVSFTDPATEAALQQILDLLANGELTFSGGGFGPGGGQADDTVPLYSNVINAFSFGGGGPGGGGNNQSENSDGIVPFPRGNQYNAVAFNLGTAYISVNAENPEACYRFISTVSQSTELFDSMPARYSQIDNPDLAQAQGDDTVAFYRDLANLIDQPTTLVFPNNINAGNFGMTNWLFDVFDRYVAGEVVDLNADLADAEQATRAYIDCVAALPPFNPGGDTDPQDFFAQIQACQASATA